MFCNYCGEPADTRDHLIPVSASSFSSTGTINNRHAKKYGETVWSCQECNSLLGSRLLPSVEARATVVAKALTRRYSKLLQAPVWDADELAEIGPSLRSSILADAERKRRIKVRIAYARAL